MRTVAWGPAGAIAAAVCAGLFWITILPPLQGPDEEGHFSYTQWIVERGEIPWYPKGASIPEAKKPYSPEVAVAEKWAGVEPLLANPSARPLWTGADRAIWSARDRALPNGSRAAGPPATTFRNPPLYYLYAAVPYELARGGSIFDRLYLMRAANLLLLVLAVGLTWLLAGALGVGRLGQTLAAAAVGLQPQLLNVTATVGPDVLLVVLWTGGIYLGVRLVREPWSPRLALAAAAVVAACALSHPRGAALALPLCAAFLIAAVRGPLARYRRFAPPLTASLLVIGLAVVAFVAGRGTGSAGGFASYLWQFYLPRLGFMTPSIGPPDYGFREAFVDRLWGGFADLEVVQPDWLTTLMFVLTLALLVGLVALAVQRREQLRASWADAVVPLLGVVGLLLVLHLTAYRALLTTPGDPIITGRHVLPLVPIFACGAALLLERLPWKPRRLVAAVALSGVVLVQLGSAGLLLERFYA
ncbi:MAG TPA: hypothetical protein VF066_05895 [Thermoleophilaceae bacterium]